MKKRPPFRPVEQTSTKPKPESRWANQYLKKKSETPPDPLGKPVLEKKSETPPGPLGKPVLKKRAKLAGFVFVSLVSVVVSVCLNGGCYTRKHSQICQIFVVSVVSVVLAGGFRQENSQIDRFCVCLTCLTCLTCLRGASLAPEKKHRSVWADQYHTPRPFGQTSTNPNPPKLLLGPNRCWAPHLLGQTSTKQTPSTRWASQYVKKNPPRPVMALFTSSNHHEKAFRKKRIAFFPRAREVP